jgi:alkylation response protein AidB-like acyl-CoA dehydrogenase
MSATMELAWDPSREAFRQELIAWLEENRPDVEEMLASPPRSTGDLPLWARAWLRRLFDAGYLLPSAPAKFGGRNASPVEELICLDELARRNLPRSTNPQGLTIVAPSILESGTDAQIERYGLPVLRGEKSACLGMSEPDAGSDLAGLKTRAQLRNGDFVVNGQKLWTSGAHHADFCFCFVRTDVEAPKHQGISVLLIDMDSPGITTRRIANFIEPDRPDFNEVFFDDVHVPAANLVGRLHDGWSVGRASLAKERSYIWTQRAARIDEAIDELLDMDTTDPAWPLLSDRDVSVGRLYADAQAVRLLGYGNFERLLEDPMSPEHSVLKLFATEALCRLYLTGSELQGAAMVPAADQVGRRSYSSGIFEPQSWLERYFMSITGTLVGGTSEIQRNQIAERVLGLPRAAAGSGR